MCAAPAFPLDRLLIRYTSCSMNNLETELVTMQGIDKSFPGVQALSRVDFGLLRGEVHALMGENGAGKSTLIKVLTGVEQPDRGTIALNGHPVSVKSPLHAQELGISTVYQEINLCLNLSVAENIFIGHETTNTGMINWKAINSRAKNILANMGIDIDVTQLLGTYPVAIQQMVSIARALQVSAQVLILDEPTSSLDASETEILFDVIRGLKSEGMGIIFITHFLDQVYKIADRITVLRNGRLVGTFQASSLPRLELVSRMIGKELENLDHLIEQKTETSQDAQVFLEARGVGASGVVAPFDLSFRAGEVIGFAGLLGSGRTEVARLLFGLDKADSGTFMLGGEKVTHLSPEKALNSGIAFCPEDRKADGIVEALTVRENIVLALQSSRGWFRYLSKKEQSEIADWYIQALAIHTPSAEQIVKNLSGGNQQKVILARWLATNPHVLILDEPTRGIDIGTKTEIQKWVLNLAAEGKSILFISSELDEVLRCSHRVKVLRDRQMVRELQGDNLNGASVMEAIAGSEVS